MRRLDRNALLGLAILAATTGLSGYGSPCDGAGPGGPAGGGPGGSATVPATDDGLPTYFRGADLLSLSTPELAAYPDVEPGDSEQFYRGFPGAPPQIPHSVEDMLPITARENACLDCHHPDNADVESGDRPLPESHFENAVIGEGGETSPSRTVVTGYERGADVAGTRYNCTICHTPQAANADTPVNTFDREE